jgi:hypothetical protein
MSPTTARRARRFFVAALGATALAPAASAAQQQIGRASCRERV